MKRYVVESIFEHNGLKCAVVMHGTAHRCGYVGVPKEHRLYGKYYDDYLEIKKADIRDREISGIFPLFGAAFDEDERVKIEAYFQCHGGITYADGGEDSQYPIESDLWWFGFDCAHAGDKNDYEAVKKLFADDAEALNRIIYDEQLNNMYPIKEDEARTLEYVSNECKKLAEQLASFVERK